MASSNFQKGARTAGKTWLRRLRKTFEETGYPCRQLPLDLITRVPEASAQTKAAAVPVPGSGEPFMLTLRRTEDGEVKFIWWFASVRTGEG